MIFKKLKYVLCRFKVPFTAFYKVCEFFKEYFKIHLKEKFYDYMEEDKVKVSKYFIKIS